MFKERRSINGLFQSDEIHTTLSNAFKRKDYGKILSRLRNYQDEIIFLMNPPRAETEQFQRIDTHLAHLNQNIKEIELSTDCRIFPKIEISEDMLALGFQTASESLISLTLIVKIMHEYLERNVRATFTNHFNDMKSHKLKTNICQECRGYYEASNLKKLKTCFGLDYKEQSDIKRNQLIQKEKEDLALKQKDDFIFQVSMLLDQKQKMANLPISTKRYKQLVDCLSKMDELDKKMSRINQNSYLQNISEITNQEESGEQILKQKYQRIIEDVKNILNSKFKEGYSTRIQTMLDKFEIVSKNQARKIEKKNIINVLDAEVQTVLIPEQVEICILKEDLSKKHVQLQGIKQGRKVIEAKYMKLLQSQRRVSKDYSNLFHKQDKLQNKITQQDKYINLLKKQLGQPFQQIQDKNVEKKGSKTQKKLNTKHSQSLKFSDFINERQNNRPNKISQKRQIQTCSKNTQTQEIEQKKQEQLSQGKKKMIKMFKRATNPIADSSLKKNMILDCQQKEIGWQIISKIVEIKIIPQINKKEIKVVKFQQTNKKIKRLNKKNHNKKNGIKENDQKSPYLKQNSVSKQSKEKRKGNNEHHLDQAKTNLTKRTQKNKQMQQFRLKKQQKSKNYEAHTSSRQFKNINLIRLTELPANRKFRLNHIKTEISPQKSQNPRHSIIKQNKNIVRINKYQKKNEITADKEKVKQILSLLKMNKQHHLLTTKNYWLSKSKKQLEQDQKQNAIMSDNLMPNVATMSQEDKEKEEEVIQIKENIPQKIEELKVLIESEYTYLKAAGFIDYLLSFEKKHSLLNRTLIKYKFQFTHITDKDLCLFGGVQEMINHTWNIGIWQRYFDDENTLKLYYKHMNFATKISKYFLLLKKYTSYLTDPYGFSLSHFKPQVTECINKIIIDNEFDQTQNKTITSNESTWKRIMMRLIRYHNETHRNCQHIAQFLDKIGFYRYSI